MVARVPIYKKTFHVDFRDVDFHKKLKLSSLFSYFQDTANLASEELDLGIHFLLEKYGVTWVLMRIRTDIIRHPVLNEEITIETWPITPTKVEFGRDFLVRDKHGEVIVKGVSSWILMDINSRRIRRTDSIKHDYVATDERAIVCELGKIRSFGHLETAYRKTIGYSDIDLNGHLTNSKYVDYIMDCFSIEEHQKNDIRSLEVNYLNEALPGETLILKKDTSQQDKNIIYVEGVEETKQKTSFRAQFSFTSRE